jgi:hypothetical protein
VGLLPNTVQLVTIYAHVLTVSVLDQFDGLIGDLYQGAELSEPLGPGGVFVSLNQPLSSASAFLDHVGIQWGTMTVSAGSSQANSWPSASRLPLPSGCATGTQTFDVKVDGFLLNPAIVNRMLTICGDGTSVTSPPVTITISWP